MRTTLVIPSYQRRDALQRLLLAIDAQARPGLDVVVVLDGSTDGSIDMLQRLELSIPLRWITQPNAGQGAARNAGIALVEHDGLVWFLDDDMVPSPGLVDAHLAAHADGNARVVMGPCLFPVDRRIVPDNRSWADHVYDTLVDSGTVRDVSLFSVANTSAPVALWRQVGGFHEGFVGWGAEDHELGVRLLDAGLTVVYDASAVAWHHQERSIIGMCRTKEAEGANLVRLAQLHPDQLDELFPPGRPSRCARRLRPLARGSRVLLLVARSLAVAAFVEERLLRRYRLLRWAVTASLLAGVAAADADGTFLRWSVRGRRADELLAIPRGARSTGEGAEPDLRRDGGAAEET